MLNPCCCLSPRIGAFIFGVLDMIVAVTYALAVVDAILNQGLRAEMIGEIVFCVCLVTMALLLILGAWKQAADKIRLWLILWVIFLILSIVFQGFNIAQHHAVGARQGGSIVGILLMFYQIWVVYAYLVELRTGPAGLTYCPTQITV